MLLLDFLTEHPLIITDTKNLLNLDFLNTRLKSRFGRRRIRQDLTTVTQINETVQNIFDVNAELYHNLLMGKLNPFETYSETGERNTTGKDTLTGESNTKTTNGGTITTDNTSNNSGESEATTISKNSNLVSVYAYDNQTNPSPKSSDSGNGNTSTTANYTEMGNSKNTVTNDTNTNSNTITDTTNTNTEKESYNKNGYNSREMLDLFIAYKSAYDIICNDIIAEICVCVGF